MSDTPLLMTRRRYLTIKTIEAGAPWWMAQEAVASTALEHSEWDMHEIRTWAGWETP